MTLVAPALGAAAMSLLPQFQLWAILALQLGFGFQIKLSFPFLSDFYQQKT